MFTGFLLELLSLFGTSQIQFKILLDLHMEVLLMFCEDIYVNGNYNSSSQTMLSKRSTVYFAVSWNPIKFSIRILADDMVSQRTL